MCAITLAAVADDGVCSIGDVLLRSFNQLNTPCAPMLCSRDQGQGDRIAGSLSPLTSDVQGAPDRA